MFAIEIIFKFFFLSFPTYYITNNINQSHRLLFQQQHQYILLVLIMLMLTINHYCKHSQAPTPIPTPDPSEPCSSFTTCSLCVDMGLHPTRSCRFCATQCQATSLACSSTVNAVVHADCPTPSPVCIMPFGVIYFVLAFFVFGYF